MQQPTSYSTIKAVLFDLDGTLTDTFALWAESVCELVRRHTGRIISDEEYRRRYWGMDARSKIRELITTDPASVEQCYRELLHILLEKTSLVRPLPGARDAVAQLRRFLPVAVISNGPVEFVRAQLATVGMDGWFAVEIADAEPKPSPNGILRACAELGFPPSRLLFVGDSRFDQQAAEAAGCPHLLIAEDQDRTVALRPLLGALRARGHSGAEQCFP